MTQCSEESSSILTDGYVVMKDLCQPQLIEPMLKISKTRLEEKLSSLGDKKIGIGSAAGFKEICQRSEGRWDVPMDLEDFSIHYKEFPWWPVVSEILGEDAAPCFQGVISSAPKTPDQEWHIDSPHTEEDHTPPNIINILIALEDIDLEMGPTEIAVATHKHTNHLKNPRLVIDELVYQCPRTSPETLLEAKPQESFKTWTSALSSGTCILFDDRVMHRGKANRSNKFRHVAYFSYKRSDYNQNTYFETERSVFEEPTK